MGAQEFRKKLEKRAKRNREAFRGKYRNELNALLGLSKEEIDRMTREAESHASEDAKRREEIETKNLADTTAYQAEKMLRDNKDKIPEELNKEVESKVAAVKSALQGSDLNAIKQATEELTATMQKVGQTVYQQQPPPEGAQPPPQEGGTGNDKGPDEGTVEGDPELIDNMLDMLEDLQVDYTLFLRTLSHYEGDRTALLRTGLYHKPMNEWLDRYDERIKELDQTERKAQMLSANPKYVLKNYMLQEAIDAAEDGNFSVVDDLFKIAQNPFNEHPQFERWAGATPDEFKNKKLSCSS